MRKCPISLGASSSLAALLAFGAVCSWPATGQAQDEDSDLVLYGEPTSFTDVADAFDEDDPFDLNVSLRFHRTMTSGTIQRETNPAIATDGRATANFVDIADHSHVRNTLELGADVGLFHDLAVEVRLPIVLSDSRQLESVGADPSLLTVTEPSGGTAELFRVPFTSPTRSGLDYIGVTAAWSIFNQFRDPEYPTWVIRAGGQFSLGEPMHACADGACSEPGVSEGTNALELETRASYRYRYVEPYAGLRFNIAFPGSADEFFSPGGDLSGFMNTIPPRIGEMTAGVAVVPWEHRGRWQRFVVDLRLVGTYVSEGHGYSPLYDALGTSQTTYLTTPSCEQVVGPMVDCPREVEFNGLTDMEAHGRVGVKIALEMQAARYIRFNLGGGFAWDSPYAATFADACNPNLSPVDGDPRKGTCRNGIINPHHRAVIDLPGNRFRVDGEWTWDLFASATGQF